jgi:uncharacterized protein YndB with AHSA1/START domain
MEISTNKKITVQTTVRAPLEKVWKYWTSPEHVKNWNNASDDWHTPSAKNDLREGGEFTYRMEAKDGSMGFDFGGVYESVKEHKFISYKIGDGRAVTVSFDNSGSETIVTETFDAEQVNSEDLQRSGWQAILDNFKKYTENN